jgi:hypothetical protein
MSAPTMILIRLSYICFPTAFLSRSSSFSITPHHVTYATLGKCFGCQIWTSNYTEHKNAKCFASMVLIKLCMISHIHVWLNSSRQIHSISILSYDRSKASSKASSPHSATQSFLLQMRVSSPFLKVIQWLPTSSSLSSCHFYPPLYLSFSNPL